ncbi:MAG: hypothetical protein K2H73_06150 [Treponemataceae bacterium]|nr:hypothetical protein [Treponemataceae bacterium]
MAIQPIDLQTMYSQMQNVARDVANAQFQPQLAQQMREMSMVQQQQERAQTVQRAANEEAQPTHVDPDGRGGDSQQSNRQGEPKGGGESTPAAKKTEIREGFLGRHVDVTR